MSTAVQALQMIPPEVGMHLFLASGNIAARRTCKVFLHWSEAALASKNRALRQALAPFQEYPGRDKNLAVIQSVELLLQRHGDAATPEQVRLQNCRRELIEEDLHRVNEHTRALPPALQDEDVIDPEFRTFKSHLSTLRRIAIACAEHDFTHKGMTLKDKTGEEKANYHFQTCSIIARFLDNPERIKRHVTEWSIKECSKTYLEVRIPPYNRTFKDDRENEPIFVDKELEAAERRDCPDLSIKFLPYSLLTYTSFTRVDLSRNKLVAIPQAIERLRALCWLNLSENYLEAFPQSLLSLTNLESLNLNDNSLSTLPKDICKLQKLRWLGVRKNGFSRVPAVILANLLTLDMGDNHITQVPREITRLTSLRSLKIDHNPIEKNFVPRFMFELMLQLQDVNITAIPDRVMWEECEVFYVRQDQSRCRVKLVPRPRRKTAAEEFDARWNRLQRMHELNKSTFGEMMKSIAKWLPDPQTLAY